MLAVAGRGSGFEWTVAVKPRRDTKTKSTAYVGKVAELADAVAPAATCDNVGCLSSTRRRVRCGHAGTWAAAAAAVGPAARSQELMIHAFLEHVRT